MSRSSYRGRFAPSPTGPLHFGSLVAAIGSYLEARSRHGEWRVRIEDLDPLRETRRARQQILQSLETHGLHSDGPVTFQSERHSHYEQAIENLLSDGKAYFCTCSRKQLAQNEGRHPNACRQQQNRPSDKPCAIRFALQNETLRWEDDFLGGQVQVVRAELDDPVIKRKEGFYAYQLAVVVDDILQGVTHIVRGSDLLDLTAQQIQLFRALGAKPPAFAHIPVILNAQGQKLSKQNLAPGLDDTRPMDNIRAALQALGQPVHSLINAETPTELLAAAARQWDADHIPRHSQTHVINSG